MNFSVRMAVAADESAIVALLPRLADFDVPATRAPEHLWHGDRDMVRAWAKGERSDVDIAVATADDASSGSSSSSVAGVVIVSERTDIFSGAPSAHLETLAVQESAQGLGVGSALLREADRLALARGAQGMSLHVFAANSRARALYERHGYDGELLRYFRPLK